MDRIKKVFGDPEVKRQNLINEIETLEVELFEARSFAKNRAELVSWFENDEFTSKTINSENIKDYFDEYMDMRITNLFSEEAEELTYMRDGLCQELKQERNARVKRTKKIKRGTHNANNTHTTKTNFIQMLRPQVTLRHQRSNGNRKVSSSTKSRKRSSGVRVQRIC